MTVSLSPLFLGLNRPTPRPYRGGAGIERFRRLRPTGDDGAPEDFLASTTTTFGSDVEGLTVLDGGSLREAIDRDPQTYLGTKHVEAFGSDTRLLCKLIHTGERLFVHVHPDAEFARREIGANTGKTEAWIVLDAEPGATRKAWLGFRRDVDEAELARWFAEQDGESMLGTMNEVELRRGDTLFVPAGLPHAIGAGVLILELQEPADLSIILEHAPFERLSAQSSLLGLDETTALRAVNRCGIAGEPLRMLKARLPEVSGGSALVESSRRFFRAERLSTYGGAVDLAPQFSVLVATDGAGYLTWQGGSASIRAGDTVLVPYGAGAVRLEGEVAGVRCMPPPP
jgi:mannose-6-phosphate isomerase